MATKTEAELLDVVGLMQATEVNQNAEVPTLDNPPFDESPPSDVVQMAKKAVTLKSDKDTEQSIKDQFFAAIDFASQIPKDARFETFNNSHQQCAASLINVFHRIQVQNFKCAVEYAQTKINPSLLHYALSVAMIHRNDAVQANIQLPSHCIVNPAMYFDMGKITNDCANNKENTQPVNNNAKAVDTTADFTANNQDPEHKVAYFREDIGLNLHHRHWHEVYPFHAEKSIVNKDRRGELFYYMHQQIVARYNFERLCNGLPRAKPFADFRQPIEEAYFPKLDSLSKSKDFSSRPANAILKDLHRDDFYVKLSNLERWRDRIFDAIDRGYVYTICEETNEEVRKKIDPKTGIDKLGNTIEAVASLSWNYKYYGDLHNSGHLFFSFVHDPDNRYKEVGSVMSHAETALRDPIFYRWHVFIDDMFQQYKRTLPSYTLEERQFENIIIDSVKIESQGAASPENDNQNEKKESTDNVLTTFWQKDSVDVTQGLLNKDAATEKVLAVFTHLQHDEFAYVIKVRNTRSETVTGTVRIFIAPQVDESGKQMNFNGQRRMFIEMDKFTYELVPGENTITRKSTESSVTIPFEKSFMTFEDAKKLVNKTEEEKNFITAQNGYCGCGWPQHLLVGKGSPGNGFKCHLFVMITDYNKDKVDGSLLTQKCCDKSSLSYCGIRNKKYPDKKPMGFPFDRDIKEVKADIFDFMTKNQKPASKDGNNSKNGENCKEQKINNRQDQLSNMIVVEVRVKHEEERLECGKSLKDSGYCLKN